MGSLELVIMGCVECKDIGLIWHQGSSSAHLSPAPQPHGMGIEKTVACGLQRRTCGLVIPVSARGHADDNLRCVRVH